MNVPRNDDEKFENLLRQFRPRAPRPLRIEEHKRATRRRLAFAAWAVAASLLVVIGAVLWLAYSFRNETQTTRTPEAQVSTPVTTDVAQSISLTRLSRLMLEDPAKADAELDRASLKLLHDVLKSKGALGALAGQ